MWKNILRELFLFTIILRHCECQHQPLSEIDNITQIIAGVLEHYDIRLRPDFGGKPLYVGMEMRIASFDAISEVNMDYTITLYLNQHWVDARLAFSNESYDITLSRDFATKIWVPDTFFANDKNSYLHDLTDKNRVVRLSSDGRIKYGMRFTSTLACMMDLHYYPLDSQNCTVEIESYGYTVEDVVMYWMNDPITGIDNSELPQFSILGYSTSIRLEELASGSYQRLSLVIVLKRSIGYFIFQTYLPCILIVMLSWVSFWINHEATSPRVALGITTVLTMTTISTGVRSTLPRISYVKAIDIYLVMCFIFVFAALLEYAAVNYSYWGPARARKKKLAKFKQFLKALKANEELAEKQERRASPIPHLRCRKKVSSDYSPDMYFPPSFRKPKTLYYSYGYRCHKRGSERHRKFIKKLKKTAIAIKASIPRIKDIDSVDKFARVLFPLSFILFNSFYWCFYIF